MNALYGFEDGIENFELTPAQHLKQANGIVSDFIASLEDRYSEFFGEVLPARYDLSPVQQWALDYHLDNATTR
jgi:hypothetical protein